ncbi:hypothetical protein H5410_001715 [Solanum commersonii]|uniref:Uncharacterized protein n=1 Tax=Solanum commersonii TaxID=4109 RepID=A0A9J6AZT3_SOLCO|nr:hypothetical protein H5410_001715 [Solanum commersonii]
MKELWDVICGSHHTTKDVDAAKRGPRHPKNLGTHWWQFSQRRMIRDCKENVITETRMRRIIVHGLRPKYIGIITVTRGWATKPTFFELENMLASEEDLEKPLSSLSINDEDKTLLSKRKDYKKRIKEKLTAWRRPKESTSKKLQQPANGEVLQLWKEGTLHRDCWYKKVEGNVATSSQNQQDEEEEWDFETFYTFEERNQQEELIPYHSNKEEEIALITISEMTGDYKRLIKT